MVKSLVNKLDFEALEVKMKKVKVSDVRQLLVQDRSRSGGKG